MEPRDVEDSFVDPFCSQDKIWTFYQPSLIFLKCLSKLRCFRFASFIPLHHNSGNIEITSKIPVFSPEETQQPGPRPNRSAPSHIILLKDIVTGVYKGTKHLLKDIPSSSSTKTRGNMKCVSIYNCVSVACNRYFYIQTCRFIILCEVFPLHGLIYSIK